MAEVDKDAIITVGPSGLDKSFHADYVCDGVDDQVEINDAIVAANAAGGGIVRVLTGTYSTTGEITLLDNVHLRGSGMGASIIRAASGATGAEGLIIARGKTNTSVRGFTVDGATNDVTINGIVFGPQNHPTQTGARSSKFTVVENEVLVKKTHNYAIWSARGADGLIVFNHVDGGYTAADYAAIAAAGTWASQNQEGIELYGSVNVLVFGNTVENVGGGGIFLGSNMTDDFSILRDVRVLGNTVRACIRSIRIPLVFVGDANNGNGGLDRVTIADNQISDAYYSGIDVVIENNGQAAADNIPLVRGLTITNNVITMVAVSQNPDAVGLTLFNQTQDLTNPLFGRTQVHHNVVRGVANTSITGRNAIDSWKGFDWHDNDLDCEVTASGGSFGTTVFRSQDFTFCNDRVRGNSRNHGLVFGTCSNFTARDNTVVDWNSNGNGLPGVLIDTCTDFELSGTRLTTTMLTSITAFISVAANCDRFTHFLNTQIGTSYTGVITSDASAKGIDPVTGGYKAIATDAALTLKVGVDPRAIRHTGTLTAARAVTLSTQNASAGDKFVITRTGGGAFNLNVGTGPLKALATNTWCEVTYNGSAWYLSKYGAL